MPEPAKCRQWLEKNFPDLFARLTMGKHCFFPRKSGKHSYYDLFNSVFGSYEGKTGVFVAAGNTPKQETTGGGGGGRGGGGAGAEVPPAGEEEEKKKQKRGGILVCMTGILRRSKMRFLFLSAQWKGL